MDVHITQLYDNSDQYRIQLSPIIFGRYLERFMLLRIANVTIVHIDDLEIVTGLVVVCTTQSLTRQYSLHRMQRDGAAEEVLHEIASYVSNVDDHANINGRELSQYVGMQYL